jgi:hypothetical protein
MRKQFNQRQTVQTATGCVIPPPGMVSWWPGDGNANDIKGANHGTYTGPYTTGKVGQAFDISGSGNAVTVPNHASLEPIHVTLDAWIRGSPPTNYKWIVAKGASHCDSASYGLYVTPNQDIRFIIYDGNAFGVAGAIIPNMWNNNWKHVAGTYDGSAVKLYVDGALVATTSYTGAIKYNLPTNNDLLIGKYYATACPDNGTNNYAFEGAIDEVELFDRALAASEIYEIYDAGAYGKCKYIRVDICIRGKLKHNCRQVSNGLVTIIILGRTDFDVTQIDCATLQLNGMSVQSFNGKTLCRIIHGDDSDGEEEECDQGFPNLLVKFDPKDLVIDSDVGTLTGYLYNGTPIKGEDSICLKKKPQQKESKKKFLNL